jgi:alpha-1,6-mannosyltransferase
MRPDRARAALDRGLALLVVVNLVAFATYAVLSYGLAPLAPFGQREPLEAAAFARLADALLPLGGDVQRFVRGESVLAAPGAWAVAYATPLAVSSLVFVLLLSLLARHRDALTESHVSSLFRASVAFGALHALAAPTLVQDFWLSPAWGRMVASAANPYYVHLTPDTAAGIPLDDFVHRMTYGPLWALASGGLAWLAGGFVLLEGALFKLLIGAAWLGVLWMVRDMLRGRSPWDRCVGVAIIGWMPLVLVHAVGDAHNGIVMVALVMLWLRRVESGRILRGPAALAGSVMVKYVTAPLFLLDLLHHVRAHGAPLRRYWPRALAAAAVSAVALAPFMRSADFFSPTLEMSRWHFYTPRDAVVSLGRLLGVRVGLDNAAGLAVIALAVLVQLGFLAVAVVGVRRYWRAPDPQRLREAALAVVAGVLFGVVGHLWPWFVVWGLPLAALSAHTRLARWTIGVALAAPFPMIAWVTLAGPDALPLPTVLWYAAALVAMLLLARALPGRATARGDGVPALDCAAATPRLEYAATTPRPHQLPSP